MKCKVGIRTKRACDATWLQCLLCKLGIKDFTPEEGPMVQYITPNDPRAQGLAERRLRHATPVTIPKLPGHSNCKSVMKTQPPYPPPEPVRPVRRFGQELKEKVEASGKEENPIGRKERRP